MTRDTIVERAILIALTQRDMSKCSEEHSLYASVCRVLEESSKAFCTFKDDLPLTAHLLSKAVTPDWCRAESAYSPFGLSDLRKAVAGAMRLAKKELHDE
tara:strand:- start:59 stop:358 length:300 start_codon:yes stop_codon:yes gene_type:complete